MAAHLYFALRRTGTETAQAVLPPAFYAFDEFFVARFDAALRILLIILFSHA